MPDSSSARTTLTIRTSGVDGRRDRLRRGVDGGLVGRELGDEPGGGDEIAGLGDGDLDPVAPDLGLQLRR